MFDELSVKEKKILKAIQNPDDIKTIKVIDIWEDDHIDCVGVKINNVEIGFWCVGAKFAGYFDCVDSKIAKKKIFDALKHEIELNEAFA